MKRKRFEDKGGTKFGVYWNEDSNFLERNARTRNCPKRFLSPFLNDNSDSLDFSFVKMYIDKKFSFSQYCIENENYYEILKPNEEDLREYDSKDLILEAIVLES